MLVEEKGLRLPRIRLQMLPLLSRNKLLTIKLPRQRLRIFILVLFFFFVFYVYCFRDLYYVLIINEGILILFYVLWQVMVNYSAVISFFFYLCYMND